MREQLEAAIDANPEVPDNYLVLGDWLQQHQDPRGELIGLCRATGIDRTEDAKARIEALQRQLGPAAPKYGSWDWFYGFVRYYQNLVDEDDQDQLAALFEHPSLRFLDILDLGLGGREYDERQWLVDLIAARPRLSWRSLTLNCYWSGGNDPPAGDLDLSALWSALPQISHVHVTARNIIPGEVRSETLTALELDGEVMHQHLEPLLAGSAPNLRELVLHDVGPAIRIAIENAPIALPLTRLQLPHVDASAQRRILERYPVATFSPSEDGDRYERTGE